MILQGNGSGHGERKQAWQALTGPFRSSQYLKLGYESGLGEQKQAWQGWVGLFRAWNRGMKHLTI